MKASNQQASLPLSDQEYERWSFLLEQRAGLRFATQRSRLQTGLHQRMQVLNSPSLDAYYRHVSTDSVAANEEWHTLLDGLTVRETRFFRDAEALALAVQHVQACLTESHGGESLNVLSAGCASGEEAWSLALLLRQALGEAAAGQVCIQARDISPAALAQARMGRYAARRLQDVPEACQAFFDGEPDGQYSIQRSQLPAVRFQQHNLLNALAGRFDVIVCQNVLIYFQPDQRCRVVQHLVDALQPGGLLITAPGEIRHGQNIGLQRYPHPAVQAWLRCKTH